MLRVGEQAFRSDTGRQRTANEDSYYARAPLFAVADGMGGAQAGEVASRIAAESFEPAPREGEPPEAYLRQIAHAANERIHNLAQNDSSRSGMGTTLTAAMVEGDDVSFAHVGDSRAYVFRDGELRLLTSDHSLVEELRRQGRLTEEQAEDHPQRSIITRALGPEAEVDVDTLTFSARPGDVFLLCSDGLTTMVKEAGIAAALSESEGLDEAVKRMVREANEAGGRDNITAVAFRLEEAEEPAAGADPTLIGPSAEDAGLTGERVRAAGAGRRAGTRQRGAPPRRRPVRTAVKVLVALVVVAAIVVGAWLGSRQVYFLGIDDAGQVALYRGLPYVLPFDLELYSDVQSATVPADLLPTDRRDEATDHELRSHDDAASLLDDLRAAAVTPLPQPPAAATVSGADQSGSSAGGGGAGGSREAGLSGRKSQGTPGSGDGSRGDHPSGPGDGTRGQAGPGSGN
ncbi:MAG: Stp1/IreP family PP2C-type Ser/Thr phosphatase [Solirubrobacterales bacterium]|nr:Stp1/IreP family PP2C-type Ser/Thr phosphatase [Solirubrobacterales bacterium]